MKKITKAKAKKLERDLFKKLEEHKDIEFVECHFTDMQGNTRSVTLTKEYLAESTIAGVDGSSVYSKVVLAIESGMLAVPDLDTLFQLPWSQDTARILCNAYYPPKKEGAALLPFKGCGRNILQKVIKRAEKVVREHLPKLEFDEFRAYFAPEVEFLLIPGDYDIRQIHSDSKLKNNHYFLIPREKQNEILKEIIRYLGKMGLKKEKFHTEVSSLQYEIGIGHGNALRIADGVMTIKHIIDKVAERYGFKASFVPKFNSRVNGCGMHVHQNLAVKVGDKKINLFYDEKAKDGMSSLGGYYFAGELKSAREITALTNPLPVSFKRLVPGAEAPTGVIWDWENRTALVRGHSKGTKKIRMEYRSPDPRCNPYLAFAAMLAAGVHGIENKMKLEAPKKKDYYLHHKEVLRLPSNLGEALELMNKSAMLREWFGDESINYIYTVGINEWNAYCQEVSNIDIERYF